MGEAKKNNGLIRWLSFGFVIFMFITGLIVAGVKIQASVNGHEDRLIKIESILENQGVRDYLLGQIARKLDIPVPKEFR